MLICKPILLNRIMSSANITWYHPLYIPIILPLLEYTFTTLPQTHILSYDGKLSSWSTPYIYIIITVLVNPGPPDPPPPKFTWTPACINPHIWTYSFVKTVYFKNNFHPVSQPIITTLRITSCPPNAVLSDPRQVPNGIYPFLVNSPDKPEHFGGKYSNWKKLKHSTVHEETKDCTMSSYFWLFFFIKSWKISTKGY